MMGKNQPHPLIDIAYAAAKRGDKEAFENAQAEIRRVLGKKKQSTIQSEKP